jgi:hypothetical protein
MFEKQKINMIGGGFQHAISTNDLEPKFVQWVKDGSAPISIHIDNGLLIPINPNKKNYGWVYESKTIIPHYYEWCEKNIDFLKANFIKVFTHDVELANKSDIFQLTQTGGKSFLNHGEIYPKNKLVSMIASNKKMCPEHFFRHEMIQKFFGKCDHFGRGYNELKNKEDGLKDYCFSFAMENGTYQNMFSEKITDCFMTGTIPIYYGMPNIGDFFDINGIIILDNNFKIENLSFELYESKMDSVKKNLQLAIDLLMAEDYLYKNFIEIINI